MFDCYFSDGVTPAAGTLLVAEVEGCDYPVSGFAGEGVSLPAAYVDLNNLFSGQNHKNMPLYGGEKLTLIQFMGIYGLETAHYFVPVNGQLAEMQSPTSFSPCDGDFDDDGDVDGSDLAVFANAFGYSSDDPDYSTDCDFNDDGYVNEIDLDSFTRSFGRIDCPGQNG